MSYGAQLADYVYGDEEDGAGAFDFWLSPCGGTDLVPDDLKKAYDIIQMATGQGKVKFTPPKNIKPKSGKKGDDGNPTDRAPPHTTPNNPPAVKKNKKCQTVPAAGHTVRGHKDLKNTVRIEKCDAKFKTKTMDDKIVTSVVYRPIPSPVTLNCELHMSQACFHYSSAIRENQQWTRLACPTEAATTGRSREDAKATATWASQHRGKGWLEEAKKRAKCDMDEFPPAYLLRNTDDAFVYAGKNRKGQSVRFLPAKENQDAGQLWKGKCLSAPLVALSDAEIVRRVGKDANMNVRRVGPTHTKTFATITVDSHPYMTFAFAHANNPPPDDGVALNPCWPANIAAADPGFPLLTFDRFYDTHPMPYDYAKPYQQGSNGS